MTSSKTHLSRLNPPYRPGTQRPSQAHPLGTWPIRGVEAGEVGLRGGHSGSRDIGSLADIGGMGFAGVIARRWLLASRPAGVAVSATKQTTIKLSGTSISSRPTGSSINPEPSGISSKPSSISPEPSGISPQHSGISPEPSSISPEPSGISPNLAVSAPANPDSSSLEASEVTEYTGVLAVQYRKVSYKRVSKSQIKLRFEKSQWQMMWSESGQKEYWAFLNLVKAGFGVLEATQSDAECVIEIDYDHDHSTPLVLSQGDNRSLTANVMGEDPGTDINYTEMVEMIRQHAHPEHVDAWIQHERECVLKKGNLVLHQSRCAHESVSGKQENGERSSAILLDNPVKYFEGLRIMEQKVSQWAGLRAIEAWSLLKTPPRTSTSSWDDFLGTVTVDLNFEFNHRSEDALMEATQSNIITIGCTPWGGSGTAQPWYLQLKPLQGLLLGVFRAIEFMRQSNFSCEQFTILVAHPERSDVIEMHSLTTQDLRHLFRVIFMENIFMIWDYVVIEQCLWRFLKIFGLRIEHLLKSLPDHNIPSYEEIKLLLHYLTLIVQSICIGVHLYSNSHSGFSDHEELDEIQLIGLADAPSSIHIRIIPQQLACLGDMIGGQVWVFQTIDTKIPLIMDPSLIPFPKFYLLGRINDIIDTWGAASIVSQKRPNTQGGNIVQINIGGGKIQAVPATVLDGDIQLQFHEVLCHWIPLHQSFQWPFPTLGFRISDSILIGVLMTQGREYQGLIPNPNCYLLSPVGRLCGKVSALGTAPSGWEIDQIQLGINGGQTVTLGLLGVWKRIPSRTLKIVMMEIWRGIGSLELLVGKWGLEISPCTGNSRRVLLYSLLRHEGVITYIDSCLGQKWGGFRADIVGALAFEKTEFERFYRGVDGQQRDWIFKALGRGLSILSQTGVDKEGKKITAWHPGHEGGVPAALTIGADRSPWVGMLRESETCAVFAAISPFCLQLDIPNSHKQSACLHQVPPTLLHESRISILLCEIYLSPPPKEEKEIYQYGKHGKLTIKRDRTTRFYLGEWESYRFGKARNKVAYEYQLGLDSELLAPCLIGLWNADQRFDRLIGR
ncbi:hypothetical protein EV426DRAFT_662570 [Tirmania nivea]|nr:hypothetical protein EV426DRAFT_662570 [Tirmania nivea]